MSMDTQPASAHATILKAFARALQREAHVLTDAPVLLWQQWKKAALPSQGRQQQTRSSS